MSCAKSDFRGKRAVEVRNGLPLPMPTPCFDLVNEHVAAPSVLNRLADVPFALRPRLHQVENPEIMPPRNLSNNLLDEWLVRPGLGKGPHVEEVGPGEALHVREFTVQVLGQALDECGRGQSPGAATKTPESTPASSGSSYDT